MSVTSLTITHDQLQRGIAMLGQFVSIPTVSNTGSPHYSKESLRAGAAFLAGQLERIGCVVEQIVVNESAPYVYAECITDPNLPTLTFYSHYDVQPVDLKHWTTDPFVITERDGRLYGRGASDDKSGIVAIIMALIAYREANLKLPINVKLIFEGEEEFGSTNMAAFVKQEKRLQSAALIVMDGFNRSITEASLLGSVRGIANISLRVDSVAKPIQGDDVKFSVRLDALAKPVHSGIGLLLPDPGSAISTVVKSLESDVRVDSIHCGVLNGGNSIQAGATVTLGVADEAVKQKVIDCLKKLEVGYGLPLTIEPPSLEGRVAEPVAINIDLTDAIRHTCALVHSLRNPRGIPGFLDGFTPATSVERELLSKTSQTAESYASENGVVKGARLRGDPNESIYERILGEPNISIVNINSDKEGVTANISIRVLPGQDPKHVGAKVIEYLESQGGKLSMTVKMTEEGSFAWKADVGRFTKLYLEALGENLEKAGLLPCGGALPLLQLFQKAFPGMEMIVPGVEDPATAAHSHDESQDIGLLVNATNSLISFMQKAGAAKVE